MSAKEEEIIPRVYNRKQSAKYVGVALNTFDKLVAAGVFPKSLPYREAGVDRIGWDKDALDRALNVMSGLVANDNIDVAREKARQVLNGRKTALRHQKAEPRRHVTLLLAAARPPDDPPS